jgi:small nuclear ribonucleoprotein G
LSHVAGLQQASLHPHSSSTTLTCLCRDSAVVLNHNRHVTGTLRGFDQFMNIVLDQTVDMKAKSDIGMVVGAQQDACSSTCMQPHRQSANLRHRGPQGWHTPRATSQVDVQSLEAAAVQW